MFANILRNLEVHYHVHKSPPLVPINNQINPLPSPSQYTFTIGGTAIFSLDKLLQSYNVNKSNRKKSWRCRQGDMTAQVIKVFLYLSRS
jgi:hypothetical protein